MPGLENFEQGTIAFSTLGKIFFLSGVVSTLLASPFYAWNHWGELAPSTWVILLFVAPIINGFISLIFMSVAFPIYKWLAKNNFFGFGVIKLRKIEHEK